MAAQVLGAFSPLSFFWTKRRVGFLLDSLLLPEGGVLHQNLVHSGPGPGLLAQDISFESMIRIMDFDLTWVDIISFDVGSY